MSSIEQWLDLWAEFVDEVQAYDDLVIDDYTNDLSVRQILAEYEARWANQIANACMRLIGSSSNERKNSQSDSTVTPGGATEYL